MSEQRVSLERRIAAEPSRIFAIVSHPNGHVEIDGSGMLVAAQDAKPLTAVGDVFVMDMDREPLGDIPLGKYVAQNTVTKFTPDALIEWAPGLPDTPPFGYVYGWELAPAGEGTTDVTLYCDWSGVPDSMQQDVQWPIVPVHMLERSLENLDQAATS
jgi:hypothetical protein